MLVVRPAACSSTRRRCGPAAIKPCRAAVTRAVHRPAGELLQPPGPNERMTSGVVAQVDLRRLVHADQARGQRRLRRRRVRRRRCRQPDAQVSQPLRRADLAAARSTSTWFATSPTALTPVESQRARIDDPRRAGRCSAAPRRRCPVLRRISCADDDPPVRSFGRIADGQHVDRAARADVTAVSLVEPNGDQPRADEQDCSRRSTPTTAEPLLSVTSRVRWTLAHELQHRRRRPRRSARRRCRATGRSRSARSGSGSRRCR